MRLAFAALLGAFLVGCGGDEAGDVFEGPSDFAVEQVAAGGGTYIEGAVSYLEVRDRSGEVVARQDAPFGPQVSFRLTLDLGHYVVVSFQRPCAGNCSQLDPPRDRCEAAVDIEDATQRVRVHVTPGTGCTIDVDPPA